MVEASFVRPLVMRSLTYILVGASLFVLGTFYGLSLRPTEPPPRRIVVQQANYTVSETSCSELARQCYARKRMQKIGESK